MALVLRNGPAAAGLMAAALGAAALGGASLLSALVPSLRAWHATQLPVRADGPVVAGMAVWVIAWIVLGWRWSERDLDFARVAKVALALMALGLAGTIPVLEWLVVR